LIKESTKTSDENQNQKLMTKWLKRLEEAAHEKHLQRHR
jgi:hypothetical protein